MTAARAPLAIFVVAAIWAVVLTAARAHPTAGAIDAVGSASLAMYLIAVRGGHLPRRALAITFAIGLVIARFLVAEVILAIALEAVALVLVTLRMRRARRAWRACDGDRIDKLVAAVRATGLPSFVGLELAIVGYAIAGWGAPRSAADRYTTTSGWSLYAGVFAFLVVVETPVAHIALHAWPTAAWIATALSLYSVVWLAGDAHALRHGGITVDARGLTLRLGVRWRGHIAWSDIAEIQRGSEAELDAGILGANIVVRLRAPHTLQGPLGRRRTGASIALSLDDPDAFMQRVSSADPRRRADAR